jgi:predicted RNA-binding protein with PIN domain
LRRRLIDGYNVMHRLPGFPELIASDPEEARERFLRLLAPLALRGKEAWTVVFDGPGGGRDRSPGPIDVVFAKDADTWIMTELRGASRPGEMSVVTSDEKDIGRAARAMGATVLSAGDLIASLGKRRAAREAGPETADKPEFASELEVDYWLERFGERAEEEGEEEP